MAKEVEKMDAGFLWDSDDQNLAMANEIRFQEQCFIMMGMFAGHPVFKNPKKKYKYFSKIIDNAGGSEIMSELTSKKGAAELFNITSEELAHLQPYIRFFKVVSKGDTSESEEIEFPFSEGSFVKSGAGTSSIFTSRADRGSEVGIESVSFELLATQPAEVTNNIRCNVNLFFQNINGILKERGKHGLRYADLILRPKSTSKALEEYHPEHYRVKLVVGWAIPKSASVRQEIKETVARTRTTLNLTLKNHTFNFNMDGTANLDIEYHAWVEGAMSSPSTNLLFPTEMEKRLLSDNLAASAAIKSEINQQSIADGNISDRQSSSTGLSGTSSNIETSDSDAFKDEKEKLQELAEKRRVLKRRNRGKAYQRFLERMTRFGAHGMKTGEASVYYIDLDGKALGVIDDDVGDEQQTRKESAKQRKDTCSDRGDFFQRAIGGIASAQRPAAANRNLEDIGEVLDDVFDSHSDIGDAEVDPDDVKGSINAALMKLIPTVSPSDPDKLRINYFFLGDLLDVCYELLYENPEFKKSPVSKVLMLTGPLFLADPCADSQISARTFNIADIPISLSVFQAWFLKKIISPGLNNYLLRNLINDIIGELLPACLGVQCIDGADRQMINVETSVVNLNYANGKPPLRRGDVITVEKIRSLNQIQSFSAAEKTKKTQDCLILYTSGFSSRWLKGDRSKDFLRGIYHFDLGKNVGIIKNISFEKNDAPYLGEAKVTGRGNIAADLGGGSIYNFSAELVGNGLFVPGQYIYINPRALGIGKPGGTDSDGGETISSRLRLGGYYSVQTVESTLERGNFTTNIGGIWEADGSGKAEPASVKVPAVSLTKEERAAIDGPGAEAAAKRGKQLLDESDRWTLGDGYAGMNRMMSGGDD